MAVDTRYAVFPHSEQCKPTGRGYAVRPTDTAGQPRDRHNYGGVSHSGKVFARELAARKLADKMNGLA